MDQNPQAREWIEQRNAGQQRTPTLDVQGQVLVEPDEQELEQALRGRGLMA